MAARLLIFIRTIFITLLRIILSQCCIRRAHKTAAQSIAIKARVVVASCAHADGYAQNCFIDPHLEGMVLADTMASVSLWDHGGGILGDDFGEESKFFTPE